MATKLLIIKFEYKKNSFSHPGATQALLAVL